MARYSSRCNLSAARFPLLSDLGGRTIILPQYDQNFQKSAIFAGADQDRDVGIPQLFYVHNVMPTEAGFQSVGYEEVVVPFPGENSFGETTTLLHEDGHRFLFSPALGNNYILNTTSNAWEKVNPIAGLPSNRIITTAFVQGVHYIYYENVGCYTYNYATNTLDPVELLGLVPGAIKGIVGSNGYLICFDDTTIYWSNAVVPTDFVPSLITGAGSENVADLKGTIVACLQTTNGFILYATANAVAAKFSSNLRFPFTLREIPGSGGIFKKEHVSFETNMENHYALTTAGLQEINLAGAKLVFAEAIDFLTCRQFEDFDDDTKQFFVSHISNDLYLKLTTIASRFLVMSYGISSTEFTHALVYDILQKRWGKLKIVHVDAFEYTFPTLAGIITYEMLLNRGDQYKELMLTPYSELNIKATTIAAPRRTIGFIRHDGQVKIVDFDLGMRDNTGVVLLGKYQFMRGYYMQLFNVDVENARSGGNFECYVLPTFDGKTFQPAVTPTLTLDSGIMKKYSLRHTAINHTLLFTGSFNMVSAQLVYTRAGQLRNG